jgi:hypothetical protein
MVKGMPPELFMPGRHAIEWPRRYAQPCAAHEYIERDCKDCGWIAEVGPQPTLLSFDEANAAGQAMYDRWVQQTHGGGGGQGGAYPAPFPRDDCAWADLARVAWEAVWSKRRGG